MSWVNYDDVLGQIRSAGILVDSLEVNTHRPVRLKVEGDREKRGWYWLADIELDGDNGARDWYLVGSYGVWNGNNNNAIKVALNKAAKALTDDHKKAIAARHKEQAKRSEAMRKAEADRAAAEASRVWRAYVQGGQSDYLGRKGVGEHGVRFDPNGHGTMAIPIQDTAGRIHGIQIIRGKNRGKKLEKEYFPRGLSKQGHFHVIGAITPGGIVLLAEGYATGASLHEATGLPVVIAFDAGNLLPVAQAIAKAYKAVKILVCADDDYLTADNPGAAAAAAAAMAVSGHWIKPEFTDPKNTEARARVVECAPLPGTKGFTTEQQAQAKQRVDAMLKSIGVDKHTDFNDLQNAPDGGQHRIRAQIESAIAAAGWQPPKPRAQAGGTPKGEGDRRRAVSVMSVDDAVERFVPLDDGTGKHLFDDWTKKIVHKDQMTALLPAGVRWDDIKRHPVWGNRGSYYLDQVGFDPACEDTNCQLNTWTGWPHEPKEGDCSIQLDLLRYLCNGEADGELLFDWVIKWLSYPLQHPGAKMQSAIVVHGPQGTGKSLFFETYAKIYGEYGIVINQGAIEDKFNSDWSSRKLFILADEIVARQDMFHIKNQLKGFITGEWVRVNPKNLAAYKERNHMNMVFLSNEKQPVVLENDDRRHCIIWTPQKLGETFYSELAEEIHHGGVAALHHYLLNVDLAGFKPWTKPPMTQAKAELINLNKDSVEVFIDLWLSGDLELPVCPCKSSHLYKAYLRWCRVSGEARPRNDRHFGAHVEKLPGWKKGHKDIYASLHYTAPAKRARVVIPSSESFNLAIMNGMRDYRRNEGDKTEAQWITDGVIAFENALGNEENA